MEVLYGQEDEGKEAQSVREDKERKKVGCNNRGTERGRLRREDRGHRESEEEVK